MSSSLMIVIGGSITGVLFLIVFLIGIRILPGGIIWHKRLAIITMVFGLLHAIGAILNFLGLLPF